MMMDAARSILLIVDIQEGLAPVMADPRSVLRNSAILLRTAERLEIPVVISEQYPKGLGHTAGELLELAPAGAVVEKIHFSCAHTPAIQERLKSFAGRDQIIIAGIEAHVCVLQSALGLVEAGWRAAVVADACSSRNPANHHAAIERMRANGIEVVTTEMVAFEWLHCAGTPEFKDVIKLIK